MGKWYVEKVRNLWPEGGKGALWQRGDSAGAGLLWGHHQLAILSPGLTCIRCAFWVISTTRSLTSSSKERNCFSIFEKKDRQDGLENFSKQKSERKKSATENIKNIGLVFGFSVKFQEAFWGTLPFLKIQEGLHRFSPSGIHALL